MINTKITKFLSLSVSALFFANQSVVGVVLDNRDEIEVRRVVRALNPASAIGDHSLEILLEQAHSLQRSLSVIAQDTNVTLPVVAGLSAQLPGLAIPPAVLSIMGRQIQDLSMDPFAQRKTSFIAAVRNIPVTTANPTDFSTALQTFNGWVDNLAQRVNQRP